MSRVNFDALASEHPESKRALGKLAAWFQKHQEAKIIYPHLLARELSEDPVALATALELLVRAHVLRRVYKVTTPNGVLTDEEFDDPREIPPELPDRRNIYFDTAESDVVPVFHKVA
jgi:hypothetical protein